MRNSIQNSFTQLAGLALIPTILLCGIHLSEKEEVVILPAPIESIAKVATESRFHQKVRVEILQPIEPQEIIEEYVYDIVVYAEPILIDTLEAIIIDAIEIDECKCIPNYQPIRLIERLVEIEEDTSSILPEPILIDPSVFEAKVYPNPAIDFSNLELDIEKGNHFEIKLYDLSGQLVQNVYTGFLESGRQKFEIYLSDLESSIYIVHVSSNQQIESLKIQKI